MPKKFHTNKRAGKIPVTNTEGDDLFNLCEKHRNSECFSKHIILEIYESCEIPSIILKIIKKTNNGEELLA